MILVIGRGYIGTKVSEELSRRGMEFMLISHDSAFEAIRFLKPDAIVNCAAVTGSRNIDECERIKMETINGNAIFPVMVMNECERVGARLYHFSSGCVFMGAHDFTESDTPNFTNTVYIASKLASEADLKDKAVIMRIRMPFCGEEHPKNLLCKLRHYSQTGYLVDSINSISHADEMSEACVKMINLRAPFGIYHLTNTGSISTKEIARHAGFNAKWMDWETFYMAGNGPKSQCTLSNEKLRALMPIREINDAMQESVRLFRKAA